MSGRPELVAAVRSLRPQDPLDLQYDRDGRTREHHGERSGPAIPQRARVLPGDGLIAANCPIARGSARP